MAEADFIVADRNITSLEAGEKVAETAFNNPDVDSAERAATAGVSHPAYINYAAALTAHQSRADIETLADRRAREYGTTFAAGNFMRANAYEEDGSAADAPRPGTVYGDAPKSA